MGAVHVTDSVKELCRDNAKGLCKRGNNCRFLHAPSPQTSNGSPSNATPAAPRKFTGDCNYCKKQGHKSKDCFKKKRDEKAKAESAHAVQQVGDAKDAEEVQFDGAIYAVKEWTPSGPTAQPQLSRQSQSLSPQGEGLVASNAPCVSGFPSDSDSGLLVGGTFGVDPIYAVKEVTKSTPEANDFVNQIKPAMANKVASRAGGHNKLFMVLDGASTTGVVQDERKCTDIKEVDVYIKVGGEGSPTILRCRKEGTLTCMQVVDGRESRFAIRVRIIPGFGCDILPECFFLKRKCTIKKVGTKVEVRKPEPDGKVVLRGDALKHDNTWLFYAEVFVITPGVEHVSAPSPSKFVATTYAMMRAEGEREQEALLPFAREYDLAYKTRVQQAEQQDRAELLLGWHKRMGHRNFRDVAAQLGVSLPTKLPLCVACIEGKSRRRPLTGGDEPLHDAPRPGYAFAWDHAGPFPVKTWGGNNTLSLKMDIHSGKLFPRMTNTTGGCFEEWRSLVLQLNAEFGGKMKVARMLTDHAPYFEEHRLKQFNEKCGIIHVQAPPYTQELNGKVERNTAIILGMTRCSMITAKSPKGGFGECINAMCYVLDRTQAKAGGKLTRLELWHGRLLPKQHDRIKTWGCAFYLHLDFKTRGRIGSGDKLDPKSEPWMFVGYDPNGLGYRIVKPPNWDKVRTAIHGTFVEDQFPCVTLLYQQPFTTFMDAAQAQRYSSESVDLPTDPRGRSGRVREPSGQALRNLAGGDAVNMLDEIFPIYYDTVLASVGCPSSVPKALAGPNRVKWWASLQRERAQHVKHNTFGPAVDPKSLPPGHKPIALDCILKEKRDGTPKTRAILKGYRMTAGVDYNETFAPVPCLTLLRALFALAARYDWEIKQGDVATAFLSSDMDCDLWAAVPNWFDVDSSEFEREDMSEDEVALRLKKLSGYTIRKVQKGVPGIPQGPRLFHKKTSAIFSKLKLIQCKSEFCLYYCQERHLYLVIWVDDIFLFFPTIALKQAKELWDDGLRKELDLGEWQDIDDCLACIVTRDRPNRIVRLSQEPAARKLLLRTGMQDASDKETPMVANTKLTKKDCPSAEQAAVMSEEQRWYRSVIASFIYFVSWTRPDMAYAVSKLCKFMHNPGQVHIVALRRLLRYLKATANYGLVYNYGTANTSGVQEGVYGYYDASHADCPDTLKSTTAMCSLSDSVRSPGTPSCIR